MNDIFQGSDRKPTVDDLKAMKYLEQVIKESLRMYPSVPLISRKVKEDVQFGKFTIITAKNLEVLGPPSMKLGIIITLITKKPTPFISISFNHICNDIKMYESVKIIKRCVQILGFYFQLNNTKINCLPENTVGYNLILDRSTMVIMLTIHLGFFSQ